MVLVGGRVLAEEKKDDGSTEVESPLATSDVVADAGKADSHPDEK